MATNTISNKFYAIVAGVGPGTGRSVAIRFSKSYPVILLSRNTSSYSSVVEEINKAGGKAIGISTDTSDAESLKVAFRVIQKELPDYK